MKAQHMYICGALLIVALVLVALGSAWALLAPLGCVAMMAGMMWMMMRGGHHRGGR